MTSPRIHYSIGMHKNSRLSHTSHGKLTQLRIKKEKSKELVSQTRATKEKS